MHSDHYLELEETVVAARQTRQSLVIRGGNSKHFYGHRCSGEIIDTQKLAGIINYEPTELVITAHAGTPLLTLQKHLATEGQHLAFEPPVFSGDSTIGGVIASGLSGPSRPYTGSARDFVLGTRCLTGRGEIQSFGGQVMKNVAGYDVSRLMTGALGTLGMILEVSLKVLPEPEHEITLTRTADFETALHCMNDWAGKSYPITATSYDGENLNVRLSGKRVAVEAAVEEMDLKDTLDWPEYWSRLRDQEDPFFTDDERPLWRLSVPSMTPALPLQGDCLIEWGGALRWLKSMDPAAKIRRVTEAAGGHATLFRNHTEADEIFHPLPDALMHIHQKLKQAFDPDGIFNPGRMYKII